MSITTTCANCGKTVEWMSYHSCPTRPGFRAIAGPGFRVRPARNEVENRRPRPLIADKPPDMGRKAEEAVEYDRRITAIHQRRETT